MRIMLPQAPGARMLDLSFECQHPLNYRGRRLPIGRKFCFRDELLDSSGRLRLGSLGVWFWGSWSDDVEICLVMLYRRESCGSFRSACFVMLT